MRRSTILMCLVASLWGLLLSPLPALAQIKKKVALSDEEAGRLYGEGSQLRSARNYRGALEKFFQMRSQLNENDLSAEFLLEIAEMYEKTCDFVRAEAEYKIVAKRKADPKRDADWIRSLAIAQAKANARIELLQHRIPELIIVTKSAPPDTHIRINNQIVAPRSWQKTLQRYENPGIYWVDAISGKKWARLGPIELKVGTKRQLSVLGRGDSLVIVDEQGATSSRAMAVPAGGHPPIPEASLARIATCEEEEKETASLTESAPRTKLGDTKSPFTRPPDSLSSSVFITSGGLFHFGVLTGSMWFVMTAADSKNEDITNTLGILSLGTLALSGSIGIIGFIVAPTEEPDRVAGKSIATEPPLAINLGPGSIRVHGTF